MTMLEKLDALKTMLGIAQDDTEQDQLLLLLLDHAAMRLKRLLGGLEPPESMEDILLEVSVKRFNRIGSEGLSGHTVEGESLTFSADDFAEYADDIRLYLEAQNSAQRKVIFL